MNLSPEYLMLINAIYPVGHIYKCTKSELNPNKFIIGTTWEKLESRFLYNSRTTITNANRFGGEAKAKITTIPSHFHEGQLFYRDAYGNNVEHNYCQARENPKGNLSEPLDRTTGSYGSPDTEPEHNNMPTYRAVYMWVRTS